MNPTLDQKLIERELEKDPDSARAEWLGVFREDLEAAFSLEAIEACVIGGRDELPAASTVAYCGFVDPSGGRQDSFAIAIAHQEDGISVLDVVRAWKPRFDPSDVVLEAAEIFKRYGVLNIVGDNYGGEWPVESFRNHGFAYQRSTKYRSELYLELIPKINSKQVKLLDNRELIEELRRLERRRGRTGKDSIDHRGGSHDDAANTVAGVVSLLGDKSQSSREFNPQAHISRRNLTLVPGSWPLVAGLSSDDIYTATVIAQSYADEIRIFCAFITENVSLKRHLAECPKAWLSANSPALPLLGGYVDDPNVEVRAKLHNAAVETMNGQW